MERDEPANRTARGPQHTPLIIAAEKNLETIGFFSPATSVLRSMRKKHIEWKAMRANESGSKEYVEVSVTIDGSAMGLPTTTDLDFYTAYQCIISRYILRQQAIPDPLIFSTKELLQIAAETNPGGDQREDIRTWMQRMQKTFIESQAAVYDADKDEWVVTSKNQSGRAYQNRVLRQSGAKPTPKKDKWASLQVFVECYQEGEVVKGRVLTANMVHAAPWFKKNIERHWTKPVHAPLYFRLRRPLAKVLFRVGDGLLYAGEGSAHKRYDELCNVIGIPAYQHESRIHQQLSGPMKELEALGILERWALRPTADRGGWVLEWYAGETWKRIQKEVQAIEGSKSHGLPALAMESAVPQLAPHDETPGQLNLPFSQKEPAGAQKDPGRGDAPTPVDAGQAISPDQVRELIELFRKLRSHPRTGRPPAHETEKAEFLLTQFGPEKAAYIVDYACRQIRQTSGRSGWGRFFGSVMSYVGEGAEDFDRKQEEKKLRQAVNTGPTPEELLARRWAALSPTEIEIFREQARQLPVNPFQMDWLDKYEGEERERQRLLQIDQAAKILFRQLLVRQSVLPY